MKILQYALPRSGSTLILQVLIRIFEKENIQYSHDFVEAKGRHLIMTKRDFRDLVASHWRIWCAKFDDSGNIVNVPTIDETMGEVRTVKNRIKILERYKEFYEGYDKLLVLDYKDFFNNYEYLFNQLESFFGIRISPKKKEEIIKETNLDVKRKQQSEIPLVHKDRIFDNWLDQRDIHANHIHPTINPEHGYWKKIFPPEFHKMINDSLEKELKEWGYLDE